MLCQGEWSLFDDGISRPILTAEILRSDGAWQSIEFCWTPVLTRL